MERFKVGPRSPPQASILDNLSSSSYQIPSDQTRVLIRSGSRCIRKSSNFNIIFCSFFLSLGGCLDAPGI
ncbi:hypothetical protein MA16_Dca012852 [Dendrobium catenatum]|uniref:Uncharacterized protein n=1 Tax=Dendrobium catenatum TaxID=906689 RepID=A0A2I0VXQ1_9ASPA|nr:hypothetical protein MA16_Dca012852 [Dendrobium catenatum]